MESESSEECYYFDDEPEYLPHPQEKLHEVDFSFERIPRYLFRVQVPHAIDDINLQSVEARWNVLAFKQPVTFDESLQRHLIEGKAEKSEFVAFTASLMYAIARARNATLAKPDDQRGIDHAMRLRAVQLNQVSKEDAPQDSAQTDPLKEYMAKKEDNPDAPTEDEIEIFVVDTNTAPHGTFRQVWSKQEGSEADPPSVYFIRGSWNVQLHCARTTLGELNSLGLQEICKPYRDAYTYNPPSAPSGARTISTGRMVQRLRNKQYIMRFSEERVIEAAINMASIYPPGFDIPMALLFMSLCLPPPADRVWHKLRSEFGAALLVRSLSELRLDHLQRHVVDISTFSKLAAEVKKLEEDKAMADLSDFVRDVPLT